MAFWVKTAALLALIAAFPPMAFTSVTASEGLKMSLSLLILYFFQSTINYSTFHKNKLIDVSILGVLGQLSEVPCFLEHCGLVSDGSHIAWSVLGIKHLSCCWLDHWPLWGRPGLPWIVSFSAVNICSLAF